MSYTDCPNFNVCSVNKCPLHEDCSELMEVEGDPETKCRAQRPTREKIGSGPYGGLTIAEHRKKKNRENRTPEEHEVIMQRVRKMNEIRKKKAKTRGLSTDGQKTVSKEVASEKY